MSPVERQLLVAESAPKAHLLASPVGLVLVALEIWILGPSWFGESLTRAALETYFADPATLTGGAL